MEVGVSSSRFECFCLIGLEIHGFDVSFSSMAGVQRLGVLQVLWSHRLAQCSGLWVWEWRKT